TGAAEPRLSHSRTCTSTSRLSRKSPHDQDSRPWYELAVVARGQDVHLVALTLPLPGGDAHLSCLRETQLGADLRTYVHVFRVRAGIPDRDRDLLVFLNALPLGHLIVSQPRRVLLSRLGFHELIDAGVLDSREILRVHVLEVIGPGSHRDEGFLEVGCLRGVHLEQVLDT